MDNEDEFFDDISGNVSCSDSSSVQQRELSKLIVPEDWHEHKSVQFFDFSNDVDNGYTVSMQEPFILTHHSDGKKFHVGEGCALNELTDEGQSVSKVKDKSGSYDVKSVSSDLK